MEQLTRNLRVLLAEGDEDRARRDVEVLTSRGHPVAAVATPADLLAHLARDGWDVIVLDQQLAGHNTKEILDYLHSRCPALPVVIVTAETNADPEAQAPGSRHGKYIVRRHEPADTLGWAVELAAERSKSEYLRQALEQQLHQLPQTDALTGLPNWVAFHELFERELAASRRYMFPLSVALVGVDELKQMRNTHGRETSDSLLALVSRVAAMHVHPSDMVARYGEDQLVILFSHIDCQRALIEAQRVYGKVRSSCFSSAVAGPVAISIGVASTLDNWDADLLVRAEQARCEDQASQTKHRKRSPPAETLGVRATLR